MSDPETVQMKLRRLAHEAHEAIESIHQQALDDVDALAKELEQRPARPRFWFTPEPENEDG